MEYLVIVQPESIRIWCPCPHSSWLSQPRRNEKRSSKKYSGGYFNLFGNGKGWIEGGRARRG